MAIILRGAECARSARRSTLPLLTCLFSLLSLSSMFGQGIPPDLVSPKQQNTRPGNDSAPALGPSTAKSQADVDAARNNDAAKINGGAIPASPVDPKSYVIGPEDILMIRVWREPDFSGPVQVRPDGKFSLLLIGEMDAAGLTPDQLTTKLTDALLKYLNKPEVSVSVQSVQSKRFYITGEVNRTGAFPLIVPTSVLEALTNAGGFREYAKPNKIIIMRGEERLKFNYKDVIKGKNREQNILLQNGDYIVVP